MNPRTVLREILGIGLVLFSLFLLLSLFTFHSGDVGFLSAPVNRTLYNTGGRVGAELAFRLLYSLGSLSSWALAFLIGAWGVSTMLRKNWPDLPYKLTGIFLLLMALSVAESLVMEDAPPNLPRGGVLGIFLTKAVLLSYLGYTGSYLAVFYVAAISFLLATDFLFLETALEAVDRIRAGREWVRELPRRAAGRRRSADEPPPEDDGERRRREHFLRRERMLALLDEQAMGQAQAAWPPRGASSGAAAAPPIPEVEIAELPGDDAPPAAEPVRRERSSSPAAPASEPESREAEDSETEEAEAPAPPEGDRAPEPEAAPGEESDGEEEAPARPRRKAKESAAPAPKASKAIEIPAIPKTRKYDPPGGKSEIVTPPAELLDEPPPPAGDEEEINQARCRILEATLAEFSIGGRVTQFLRGPTITQFEVELASGTRMNQLSALQNDLALALKVESVRIVPNPRTGAVGVEVPNAIRDTVVLRELASSEVYRERKWGIPLFLGKDAAGAPILSDLTEMPHLLIAGSTGSGKSVCLNSVLAGILATRAPEQVKLVLIDPKRVEMIQFREIPHLYVPVVTDIKIATAVLERLSDVMERRYKLFEKLQVRSIAGYNRIPREEVLAKLTALGEDPAKVEVPLPYIVVVVDELSDLMLASAREVENSIIRLAQKSRAVGMHLILSTQRPSTDVLTGLIKANMSARIAFKVTSGVESRVILDKNGAEKLLNRGDMLFVPPKVSELVRAQGTFVSDEEIARLTAWWKERGGPASAEDPAEPVAEEGTDAADADDSTLLFSAGDIVLESGRASSTLLQRRLGIGYTKASRLVDHLEKTGLLGPFKGSKPREILMTPEQWDAWKKARTPS
jgi:S-DNA-T family DNA segregation ATPase FtsK/SpoIIIE